MKQVLAPFLVLAAVGLVLSIIAHIAALTGLPQPLGNATWALHFGVFVVWLPAVVVVIWLVKDFQKKEYWSAALRGCPKWMRWLFYAFFAYAAVNFTLFIRRGAGGRPNAPLDDFLFRGFSGHWMVFYSAAAAILYSAIVVAQRDPLRLQ